VNYFYLFLFVLSTQVLVQKNTFAQEEKSKTYVIFIRDLSASDYYSLKKNDEKIAVFNIVETCIPTGLMAISIPNSYNEKEAQDYTQTTVLKLISKMASFTAYTVEDLRNSCANYRKENVND
jgi:hypothetical protein